MINEKQHTLRCPHCGQSHPDEIVFCPATEKPIPSAKDEFIDLELDNRFKIHEPIARGLSGIVYKGIDKVTGQYIAIKRFTINIFQNQEGITTDNEQIDKLKERFENEIFILQKLINISYIPRYFASGTYNDSRYFISEYCDGDSLRDVLNEAERRVFDPKEGVSILLQFLQAVSLFHSNGIFHRDLKPENIIYNWKTGKIKIIDFGSARIFGKDYKEQITSMLGDLPTTPDYLGHELADLWKKMRKGEAENISVKDKSIDQQKALAKRMDIDACGHIIVEWVEDCFKRYGTNDKTIKEKFELFKQNAVVLPLAQRFASIDEMQESLVKIYNLLIEKTNQLEGPTLISSAPLVKESHSKLDFLHESKRKKYIKFFLISLITFIIILSSVFGYHLIINKKNTQSQNISLQNKNQTKINQTKSSSLNKNENNKNIDSSNQIQSPNNNKQSATNNDQQNNEQQQTHNQTKTIENNTIKTNNNNSKTKTDSSEKNLTKNSIYWEDKTEIH